MKTAEQLYYDTFEGLNIEDNEHLIPEIMVKFAQMHVEAALQKASMYMTGNEYETTEQVRNQILNAYPLKNFK